MQVETAFLAPLQRHLINLMCWDSGPHALRITGGKPKLYNISAFIVEVEGRWIGVSAGHIFEKLKTALKAGAVLRDWTIDDSLVSSKPQPAYPIAFDVETDTFLLTDSDFEGMDYACFEIAPLTKLALADQGIEAIPEAIWQAEDFDRFPLWLLVGTPGEFVKFDESTGRIFKDHATIQVTRLRSPPAGLEQKPYRQTRDLMPPVLPLVPPNVPPHAPGLLHTSAHVSEQFPVLCTR